MSPRRSACSEPRSIPRSHRCPSRSGATTVQRGAAQGLPGRLLRMNRDVAVRRSPGTHVVLAASGASQCTTIWASIVRGPIAVLPFQVSVLSGEPAALDAALVFGELPPQNSRRTARPSPRPAGAESCSRPHLGAKRIRFEASASGATAGVPRGRDRAGLSSAGSDVVGCNATGVSERWVNQPTSRTNNSAATTVTTALRALLSKHTSERLVSTMVRSRSSAARLCALQRGETGR